MLKVGSHFQGWHNFHCSGGASWKGRSVGKLAAHFQGRSQASFRSCGGSRAELEPRQEGLHSTRMHNDYLRHNGYLRNYIIGVGAGALEYGCHLALATKSQATLVRRMLGGFPHYGEANEDYVQGFLRMYRRGCSGLPTIQSFYRWARPWMCQCHAYGGHTTTSIAT